MRPLLLVFGLLVLFSGCADGPEVPDAPAGAFAAPAATEANGDVIVHLFEWRWDDVARECEVFLGPNGYDAVQVSPPTENSVVMVDGQRPWYERYQPASYAITGRSGDRAAFATMVQRCADAGIDVYVDVILNHTTGVYAGTTTAGNTFGEYDYPGLYTREDFHDCGLTENNDIEDFNDLAQVQTCELVNLADLDTGKEKVRATLAAYLNDLISLGVAGFRVDAARHVAAEDLAAIYERVEGDPYIYQEVLEARPDGWWSAMYTPLGDVTEFRYSTMLGETFHDGRLAELHGPGAIWERVQFIPDDKALVFIDNHDNQRGHGAAGHVVTHKDGALYDLAVTFMLAYPYGTARVMSSYAFESDSQGPPHLGDAAFSIRPVHAAGMVACSAEGWICEHRRPHIAAMVRFREAAAAVDTVSHWWTNGANQIAFGRGDQGFVVINREAAALETTLPTGLAPGTYCDLWTGGLAADGTCAGAAVPVDADGHATVSVPPMAAVAFYPASRLQ